MTKLTKEWVQKAESDFVAAQLLGKSNLDLADQICFHCQQAAEKYLKAIIQEDGKVVFRTHDLEALLAQLLSGYPALKSLRRGLKFLTRFAVETRYPSEGASRRDAGAALRCSARVRTACRGVLGIATKRERAHQ